MELVAGVFLSYSQVDSVAAQKLKTALKAKNIPVRIDTEVARPGDSLDEFILESIRSTKATVWVVSKASFESGWVAVEFATSLADKQLWQERMLIACYLDEEFRDDDFVLRVVGSIDTRLAKLDRQGQEQTKLRLDTTNLNAEKSRLLKLRGNVPNLLAYLSQYLCLDVSEVRFDASLERLVTQLSPLASAAELRPVVAALLQASDFVGRRKEIRDLFFHNNPERALARLMDFVHDFSDAHVDDVVVLSASFRDLGAAQQTRPIEVIEHRAKLMKRALQLIEEVIETLSREAA